MKKKREKVSINPYFTVFRYPGIIRDRSSQEMSREEQAKVIIVEGSNAFALYTKNNL